jgi:hypothetical protein
MPLIFSHFPLLGLLLGCHMLHKLFFSLFIFCLPHVVLLQLDDLSLPPGLLLVLEPLHLCLSVENVGQHPLVSVFLFISLTSLKLVLGLIVVLKLQVSLSVQNELLPLNLSLMSLLIFPLLVKHLAFPVGLVLSIHLRVLSGVFLPVKHGHLVVNLLLLGNGLESLSVFLFVLI